MSPSASASSAPLRWIFSSIAAALIASSQAAAAGFVGETTCGNNKDCHGAPLPSTAEEKAAGKPSRWARTQWLRKEIDHHSRAFSTLGSKESAAIASYMAIDARTSEKCLRCHAPDAAKAAKSGHRREDGVSCEHCHGPAEAWVDVHTQEAVWKTRRAELVANGLFYDNHDLRLRAEKCASCHVAIDHEILAAGHPPLQFEMVAYAQVMKHWNDQDELPAGAFSVDPTLWGIGQLVGLRHAVRMAGERAGGADYQGLGQFPHFADRNCYQCHHKLVDDALRQARGHYLMSEMLLETAAPAKKGEIAGLWAGLESAAASDPKSTQQAAAKLDEAVAPLVAHLQQQPLDRNATRAVLQRITASGERLKGIRRFRAELPDDATVTRLDAIGSPWWYTTGGPEQAILAIIALCRPGFGEPACGKTGIEPEIRNLLGATDRVNYDAAKFAAALARINAKLR